MLFHRNFVVWEIHAKIQGIDSRMRASRLLRIWSGLQTQRGTAVIHRKYRSSELNKSIAISFSIKMLINNLRQN